MDILTKGNAKVLINHDKHTINFHCDVCKETHDVTDVMMHLSGIPFYFALAGQGQHCINECNADLRIIAGIGGADGN